MQGSVERVLKSLGADMARDGHLSSSGGPGGRASRFLDAVVAFVVAIFHPIFRVFQQQPPPPADDHLNNHHPDAANTTTTTTTAMQSQHQSRSARACGPREVNANAKPSLPVKASLPQIGPPNGPAKQENIRQLAHAPSAATEFRTVGEEQAEENRQEQLTLPPPIHPIDQDDGAGAGAVVQDPAIAAERAIHHGFMNQALDMASPSPSLVRPASLLLLLLLLHRFLVASFQTQTHALHDYGPFIPTFVPLFVQLSCLNPRPPLVTPQAARLPTLATLSSTD